MLETVPPKLNAETQREWLRQHIPHRICAAQTWLELKGDWEMPPHPKWENKDRDKFHIWCIGRSVDEGRKVALRWLIEFIGIKRSEKKLWSTDIWIEHFDGGKRFDPIDPNIQKLIDVWQGCSQSSAHSTYGTNHPPVGEQKLAEALQIVIAHLEKYLYEPNGFSLLEIVQDQEDRRHRIWQRKDNEGVKLCW